MITFVDRESRRERRHLRIRKRMEGTRERPRLSVHRSHKNLLLQLVDDFEARTLFAISTLAPEFREISAKGGNIAAAAKLGELAARKMREKGFEKILFDRGGYLYHGRIKALADALRAGGMLF